MGFFNIISWSFPFQLQIRAEVCQDSQTLLLFIFIILCQITSITCLTFCIYLFILNGELKYPASLETINCQYLCHQHFNVVASWLLSNLINNTCDFKNTYEEQNTSVTQNTERWDFTLSGDSLGGKDCSPFLF